ncbi:MAG: IS200/IS605 family transposase [Acidobacteria bacterium]|nr:IS200/IS605 family transposase [Acidobacteriota bacterium]
MVEAKRIYHVCFSTKGRKPALQGEIESDVRKSLAQIAKRTNIGLLEFELSVDHVHMLLQLASDESLSSTMQQLKGACSREIFLEYPDLKLDMGHQAFWQKGYAFRQVHPSEVRGLRYYVRTQSKRPLRHE